MAEFVEKSVEFFDVDLLWCAEDFGVDVFEGDFDVRAGQEQPSVTKAKAEGVAGFGMVMAFGDEFSAGAGFGDVVIFLPAGDQAFEVREIDLIELEETGSC